MFKRTKLKILLSGIFSTVFLLSATQVSAKSSVELFGSYPGSWRMTGEYKCITPDELSSETEDYSLSIGLEEDDDAVFEFKGKDAGEYAGEETKYTVEIDDLKEVYYPGEEMTNESFIVKWELSCDKSPGEIRVSASFVNQDFTQDENVSNAEIISEIPLFNSRGLSEYVSIPEKETDRLKKNVGKLNWDRIVPICAAFPDVPGEEDIKKFWLVCDISDNADHHIYRMWEFEWSDEEYVVEPEDMSWVRETGGYYDAGTGVIEYVTDEYAENRVQSSGSASSQPDPEFLESVKNKGGYYDGSVGVIEYSPWATFGKLALIFLVPIVVIILLIVLIVRIIKKTKG
ncbi:MAG: hypothetical protein K6E91_09540 [Butyrivibrio sp.]|nr:hypothetical protein [Butyrivibrio sp.]